MVDFHPKMPCLLLDISPFLIICGTFYAWCSIQFCQLTGGNTIQTFLHVQRKFILYHLKIRRKTSVKDSIWSIYVCIYSRNISNLYLSRYIHMIFSSISLSLYIYVYICTYTCQVKLLFNFAREKISVILWKGLTAFHHPRDPGYSSSGTNPKEWIGKWIVGMGWTWNRMGQGWA